MKTILISGSLGFIGSHLSKLFLEIGYFIVGIDNLSNKYPKTIYNNNLNILKKYRYFSFHKVDILDQKKSFLLLININRILLSIVLQKLE